LCSRVSSTPHKPQVDTESYASNECSPFADACYRPSEDDDETQSREKRGGGYAHHCTPEVLTQVVLVHVHVDVSPATSAANLHYRAEFRQSLGRGRIALVGRELGVSPVSACRCRSRSPRRGWRCD